MLYELDESYEEEEAAAAAASIKGGLYGTCAKDHNMVFKDTKCK